MDGKGIHWDVGRWLAELVERQESRFRAEQFSKRVSIKKALPR